MARTRRSPSSRRDIRTLAGHVGLVESQAAGWGGDSGSARPNRDWTPSRIAAAPPDGMLRAAEMVTVEVMAACGVPHSLFAPGAGRTGQRESYRRLVASTVEPKARVVSTELSEKFEAGVSLDLRSLFASDLAGRARAFQSLVGGGMEVERAASSSGLLAGS